MSDDELRACGECGATYKVAETASAGGPTSPREAVRYECPDCGQTLRATDRTERVIAHERAAR